jgi:uncharacterized protein YciI/uncharacterized damage-inducible protein DinB
MKIHLLFSALFILCGVTGLTVAQTTDPQAQALKQVYNFNKRVIIASAEKMPAEYYGFGPASEVRGFAELMGHIADVNYVTCSAGRGEANPNKDEIQKTEKTAKTKDAVSQALKESFAYCDVLFNNLTDATLKETYKQDGRDWNKASMITLSVYHGGEHYGNAVVYLRMKGIVPPSSEPAQPQKKAEMPKEPPQFDLDTYQFAMLKKGPKWTPESTPETQQIQAGHMGNIQKMARLGKLMAAGPMADNGDLRGLFIFKAASIEEAKTLAAEDPAIKSGRLVIEFLTWMAPKGIGAKFQEELQKGAEPKVTMTKYYLVLFGKGTKPAPSAAENQQLMLEHLWNIRRQLDAKVFMTAGPFSGNGELRGLLVIAANSLEEAKTIAEADPMVKAGQMSVALHTWWVAKEVWP